mmetsp:Transcript_41202/g.102874  ORF Transcript_41202/g.102874 Transcript_41202/m.102874 type:complete len:396 (+) Transcript_41202:596-1783(+)
MDVTKGEIRHCRRSGEKTSKCTEYGRNKDPADVERPGQCAAHNGRWAVESWWGDLQELDQHKGAHQRNDRRHHALGRLLKDRERRGVQPVSEHVHGCERHHDEGDDERHVKGLESERHRRLGKDAHEEDGDALGNAERPETAQRQVAIWLLADELVLDADFRDANQDQQQHCAPDGEGVLDGLAHRLPAFRPLQGLLDLLAHSCLDELHGLLLVEQLRHAGAVQRVASLRPGVTVEEDGLPLRVAAVGSVADDDLLLLLLRLLLSVGLVDVRVHWAHLMDALLNLLDLLGRLGRLNVLELDGLLLVPLGLCWHHFRDTRESLFGVLDGVSVAVSEQPNPEVYQRHRYAEPDDAAHKRPELEQRRRAPREAVGCDSTGEGRRDDEAEILDAHGPRH